MFTDNERKKLKEYLDEGVSKVEIAKRLKKSRQAIYDELKRGNKRGEGYSPEKSAKRRKEAKSKLKASGRPSPLSADENKALRDKIVELLEAGMYPPEIVETLRKDKNFTYVPCTKTIYRALSQGSMQKKKEDVVIKIRANGAIMLPVELRRELNINPGQEYVVTTEAGKIVLKKISN